MSTATQRQNSEETAIRRPVGQLASTQESLVGCRQVAGTESLEGVSVPATERVRRAASYNPGGWRTVYPAEERMRVSQREPSSNPLVSKRRPATTM